MANNYPCNKEFVKFIDCCQVMDCISIDSSDNSVTVEQSECGVDLTITGNNLDQILQFNNSTCISMTKEFIEGKLVITPVIDWDCVIDQIAEEICEICNPPEPPTCPAPTGLSVEGN